jgi:hypothetical protein
MSLALGIFPDVFKQAYVTPLLKKPGLDKSDYANYRPISNLAFLGKILERIVLNQLQQHLDAVPSLNPFQSAYHRHHSTETALTKITNDILFEMDNKRVTLLALLDFSAAFDTIEHQILIERLTLNFNIKLTPLKWFRSYLTNRQQAVYVGETKSSSATMSKGVPQGSVLGPVLYNMYTAPLHHIIARHNLLAHYYADDTQIYLSCKPADLAQSIQRMEACLADLLRWLLNNNLSLNASKSELLLFGTTQQLAKITQTLTVRIEDSAMCISDTARNRNLGVWLDNTLSFNHHIDIVCRTCYFNIRKLARVRRYLTVQSAAVLATAIITSRLDYCNSLLTGATIANINRLQRIQNHLARVVCQIPCRTHISPTLARLHWLPVKQRIEFKLALLTWRALNVKQPVYLSELLIRRGAVQSRSLRDQNTLCVPRVNSRAGQRAFCTAAPCIWNALPTSITAATTLPLFKSRLKTYLFKQAYSTA